MWQKNSSDEIVHYARSAFCLSFIRGTSLLEVFRHFYLDFWVTTIAGPYSDQCTTIFSVAQWSTFWIPNDATSVGLFSCWCFQFKVASYFWFIAYVFCFDYNNRPLPNLGLGPWCKSFVAVPRVNLYHFYFVWIRLFTKACRFLHLQLKHSKSSHGSFTIAVKNPTNPSSPTLPVDTSSNQTDALPFFFIQQR